MDYLSRKIEYENLLSEIEIGGKEHAKAILEHPDEYLKKANSLKERVLSDSFLSGEDKERILKRINEYMEKINSSKSNNFWNYILAFLAGFGIGYILPHSTSNNSQNEFIEDVLKGFNSEIEKIIRK
jgi:hypothetical protein